MRKRDSLKPLAGGRMIATIFCVGGMLLGALAATAVAQTPQAPATQTTAKAPTPLSADSPWQLLPRSQKIALAPLEKFWDTLSDGQRRKWQALAKTYPDLGVSEQEKLHSRMAEWAALSPKDREAARLNFAQAKAVTKTDRAANWEAYQALSPDERKLLAHGAKPKPVGAAVAVKPVASDKLTAVPLTRHTPEQERAAAVLQRPINRNTLLPQQTGGAAFSTDVSTSAKP
jgi:hypothetical protein